MKLVYFDLYGRAEPIRLLLNHSKVEFEDVRLAREDWPAYKADHSEELEWGQVPALTVEGKTLTQTQSILRYLGKTYGYYPTEAYDAWRVDSAHEALSDLMNGFARINFEQDAEKKKEQFVGYLTNQIPAFFEKI